MSRNRYSAGSLRWSRRKFLGSTAASLLLTAAPPTLSAAATQLAAAGTTGSSTPSPIPNTGPNTGPSTTPNTVMWRNWSGALSCQPATRFSPATEAALVDFLQANSMPLRPVGSGHSFTPLVPTEGTLVVLDQLTGIVGHDANTQTATIRAGTRLGELGPQLSQIDQHMLNLPDIDRQTLAGAIATATHGTGLGFTSLSGFVTSLRLVTAEGEVHELSHEANPDLFNAARVGLGALGLTTQVTLQNRKPYRLKATNAVARTEEILENFDSLAAQHRHFEMFPLVHSDYALSLAIDETTEPVANPPESPEEAAAFGQAMAYWATLPPGQRRPHINGMAEQIEPSSAVDESYKILSNIRNNRFNEMEYSVPLHAGADCLREVLATIRRKAIDVVFPLEYRYVKRDDTWLGMSCGAEDHASISIHRTASADFRPYFDLIEPIFWKYGGRPHWGKVHSLGATQLAELYPKFADFQRLRAKLDPNGKLLNPHLRKLFLG